MKFKHVVASLSLAMFTAFGVAAGLSMKKEVKSVAAEGEKTWMFRAILNLAECSPNYSSCVFPKDKPVDGAKFHYWGVGFDKTDVASFQSEDPAFTYYAVNVSMEDAQVITGAQWIIHQKDVGDKYSVNIDKFGDTANSSLDKTTSYVAIQWQFSNDWDGDHWKFISDNNWGYPCSSFELHEEDESEVSFTKEPSINAFTVRNFEFNNSHWVEWISGGSVELQGAFYGMIDEASRKYAYSGSRQWIYMHDSATYDFIVYSGSVSIRKHETNDSYIYFVSQSNDDDSGLYAYTYGGSETFGGWPGKAVTEQTLDGLEEVDLRNGLHFQGQEHKVFRIPVNMSYPSGADHIIFHNGSDETKSVEFELVAGAAYWHTAPAAVKRAGVVLDILYDLQLTLKNSGSYDYGGIDLNNSVCAISTSDATRLYEAYDDLSEAEKTDYIEASWVRTYTGNAASLGWRTLTEVFVELGKRAGIISSSSSYFSADMSNGSVAVIVICVTTASALALTLLLVFKKRKHE